MTAPRRSPWPAGSVPTSCSWTSTYRSRTGVEATRQIKEDDETADVKVLILTTFDLGQYVYATREVLREVARGLSNTEIAERLRRSAATAKTHVSRLLMKLAARDRAQLVVVAYESELARSPAASGENATRRPSRS
jgi:DNA-binding NarL/FixJ family response regulator